MRALALALILLAAALAASPARGQQAQEHEVKAAFLYKFPAFVEWPPGAGGEGPFIIAVLGAPDVAAELARLADAAQVHGRPIRVRVLKEGESAAGAQVVFVGRESASLPRLARSLAGSACLVVSETPGGLEQGAMINFVLSEGRVRFEVALEAAERSRLRLNSRLLAVAQSVRGRL